MWIVLKYKSNELQNLKYDFKNKLGEMPIFFQPKVKYQKYSKNKYISFDNFILGNYLLCYHKKFKQNSMLDNLKFSKGLKYFLVNSIYNQKDLSHFVKVCRSNEGTDGYLLPKFFNFLKFNKGIFINGPFSNMFFQVIEERKKKLKILIENIVTTISKDSNYLYRPI